VVTPTPTSTAPLLDSLGAVPSGTGLAVNNPNAAMRMAGLQPGDQIVAINGAPAIELTRNPGLLQPIIAAGSARVDVVRAGQRMTLSVPIR
jgi:type II secretory pathway component PulC